MSPPISSAIKERVIELYLEGKGRNEIAQTLNLSHVRISQGSVSNILRTYKANTDQASTKATCPCPSQLQTSPTSMKGEVQIRLSEGPAPSQEPLSIEDEKGKGPEEPIIPATEVQDESFMDLVFEQVMESKKQRRDELLLIEQKKKELEQQRMQVDRARYDLEIREVKLLEAEPLIPIARQLQDLGTDINHFLPWVETIHEKAEAEKTNLIAAAYSLAQDLRLYRQFAGIQRATEQARQQLSVLDMLTAQKQQALSILMELQNRGVTEAEIMNLLNFAGRWNKHWGSLGPGNGSNNDGGNGIKLDDKLNFVV
jgi:hypothetical protein